MARDRSHAVLVTGTRNETDVTLDPMEKGANEMPGLALLERVAEAAAAMLRLLDLRGEIIPGVNGRALR